MREIAREIQLVPVEGWGYTLMVADLTGFWVGGFDETPDDGYGAVTEWRDESGGSAIELPAGGGD